MLRPPLLQVDDLSVEFRTEEGRLRAVDHLSFQVDAGKTLAIIGESGSGKSVTAMAIMGLLPPRAFLLNGRARFQDGAGPAVELAGPEARESAIAPLRGDRLAMIFQEPTAALSPMHTLGDQIGDVLRQHRGLSGAAARQVAIESLAEVGFRKPQEAVDSYAFQLSGGLAQRAMIAIAMICRPALIIADEPTTALDVTVQAEILNLLKKLQSDHGTAILLIAHDLGVVANMADDVVVMRYGEALESGPMRELFANPQHPYLKALMGSVPRLGMPRDERLKPLRDIASVDVPAAQPQHTDTQQDLIRICDVSKSFAARGGMFSQGGVVRALVDVSLTVRQGECLGLVGESGSGKTTLSRMIARQVLPDSGSVDMRGQNGFDNIALLAGADLKQFRRRVQYVFQNPYHALNPRQSVESILTEPLEIHGIGDKSSRRQRALELLEMVGLDRRHLNRFPAGFSGGQRQRIGIARALALEPDLILFDEPVSALDVSVQAQILNLLRDLRAALGLTYLFVSHNLAVVDYLADRIAVMANGLLVELAPREALFENAMHPYTKRLVASVPEPDPDRAMDLSLFSVMHRKGSGDWPAPYAPVAGQSGTMEEVSSGHFVRIYPQQTSTL
ncbi:ABC transporter ATP-binding protein [Aureimonas fodinaquatilis]|uniref:ABC transporter ATP-binding protein n=1 Tax=Aureimonas fodinaquatilis TaxID=2565783 RepID=A0A5B0DRK7_9HYPH|nr:ABC transporter ATP-binding protein [Aureimonas fodinaquatilis]KAA0969003.1 ABC transporter ATP-binding protein [Aureimonas fodinaquatilis]